MSEAGKSEKTGGSEPYAAAAAGAARKLFISYASQDAADAEIMCAALEAAGLPCWIAPRDVRAGESYAAAIVEAINSCRMLVLLLSQGAIDSPHVLREVERASSKRRPVLSVRMDGTKLPPDLEYFLSANQWLDASGRPIEQILPALVESVRSHDGGKAGHEALGASTPAARSASRTVSSPASGKPASRWRTRAMAVAFAVAAAGLAYVLADRFWLAKHLTVERPTTAPTNVVSDKSIAVLPFTDMSEKKDQEYFGDGMAEEILNLLVKIPGLKVIGRTSSFQFKGKTDDLRKIGATLGAVYVVEGSVRRSGDHLRVTAQLIDTRVGAHRWSETYDRDARDAIAVQDSIAAAVARALELEVISPSDLRRHASPLSAEAYDHYLRGIHAAGRFDQRGAEEAVADFRRVLELDPSFAPAAEWLARVLETLAEWHFVTPEIGWAQTREAAEAALKLDPKSASAHAVLSLVHTEYDWDWPAVERESRAALALAPNAPDVLVAAATGCLATGQWSRGVTYVDTALAADPLDPNIYAMGALLYSRLGRIADAERIARRMLDISPPFAWGHYWLGVLLLVEGRPQEALDEMSKESAPLFQSAGLVLAYDALGRRKSAEAELVRLESLVARDNPMRLAEAYAFRGQKEQALLWLDRAFARKDASLYYVKGDPLLKNLEGDPRYKAFLRKMNLLE